MGKITENEMKNWSWGSLVVVYITTSPSVALLISPFLFIFFVYCFDYCAVVCVFTWRRRDTHMLLIRVQSRSRRRRRRFDRRQSQCCSAAAAWFDLVLRGCSSHRARSTISCCKTSFFFLLSPFFFAFLLRWKGAGLEEEKEVSLSLALALVTSTAPYTIVFLSLVKKNKKIKSLVLMVTCWEATLSQDTIVDFTLNLKLSWDFILL